MNEQLKTDFLRKRMTQLRERNGYTLSQLAAELHKDKSSLSRVEAGKTSYKKVCECADDYCVFFHLGDIQRKLFLRGERVVIVETSALVQRPDLLGELCEEYSFVLIPGFVIDDLKDIKKKNPNELGTRAEDLLTKINRGNNDRIHTRNYSLPSVSELIIVDYANAVSDEYNCDVDIMTNDVSLALGIKGSIKEDSPYQLLFLEEYAATRQGLSNMKLLNAINEYFSDSYERIEEELGIKLPKKNADDWNDYLADGRTLIISAVQKTDVPFFQRREKIKWLIENGADVNKRDCESKNFPPLTHAIKGKDEDMFMFLLKECHANPNVGSRNPYDVGKIRQKNDGNMPLMVAAWENQINMVKELCKPEHHVSLNQQDGNGYTALIKACYWGNRECREAIEDAGADTSIIDHEGFTAEDRWDECLRLRRYKEK